MCADHYPPFSVYDTPAGPPRGSVVNVIKLVASELGYTLTFTPNTPFRRCLRMLADGQADIMGGLLYKQERAEFMHLFPYLNYSTKSFYALNDSPLTINNFEDLAGLTVGTTLGHQYWPAFDQTKTLFNRSSAAHVNDNFRRLLAKRIDLVIATERQALFLFATHPEYHGKFKKMAFSFTGENPVYIGLSKKSPAAKHADAFRQIADRLRQAHTFDKVSQAFYDEYFESLEALAEQNQ
ncbi:substrate-binding periplasmic protein [Simiduia agarivorans]|uniref:Family 3 extracellular solute-binding protein n=1 Tax=Simiduia agarivorans (strain DSM 21679 / JCM 13881 / BCRC 17597 / SA1) TaxID=1117647 RepID=K4KR38_SIMAS|nr:transporter substrate-binding domain-containing protein [Simiduia agarivorans]AFV00604.1 family 3 extracellular solute-binding protein [Simiduia agarivorans SA1 = DSM 21679]